MGKQKKNVDMIDITNNPQLLRIANGLNIKVKYERGLTCYTVRYAVRNWDRKIITKRVTKEDYDKCIKELKKQQAPKRPFDLQEAYLIN